MDAVVFLATRTAWKGVTKKKKKKKKKKKTKKKKKEDGCCSGRKKREEDVPQRSCILLGCFSRVAAWSSRAGDSIRSRH